MTRIAGPSLDQLDRLGDDYAGLVIDALVEVVRDVDATSGERFGTGIEDLGLLRSAWAAEVDAFLLPALGVAFEVGAAQVRIGLREAAGLTAEEESDGQRADSAQPGGD